jgi:hypothetical protein
VSNRIEPSLLSFSTPHRLTKLDKLDHTSSEESGFDLHRVYPKTFVDFVISAACNVPSEIIRNSREPISVSAHRNHVFDSKRQQWRMKVNALIADPRVL